MLRYRQGVIYGQWRIHESDFLKIEEKIPNIKEQQKIADFLMSVDNWINNLKTQKKSLEKYKKGMMQKIFSREIRFKDDNGNDFPDWDTEEFGHIFRKNNKRNNGNVVKNVLTNSANEGILDQQKYFDKDIANQENLTNYFIVELNDFIYNPRISNNAPVGPMNRNKNYRGIMSPLYDVYTLIDGDIDFIESYFKSTLWHHYMYKIANYGARYDRMSFSQQDFLKMPILFPKLKEQKKIANYLKDIKSYLELKTQQIQKAEQWKKGLMQEMFV